MTKDKGQTTECPHCGALAQMGKANPEQPGAPLSCHCSYCGETFVVRKSGASYLFTDAIDALHTPSIDDLIAKEEREEARYDSDN